MSFEDLILQNTIGMDKKTFMRKAQLMRNPGGFEKPGYCPVCKKDLIQNDQGDLFCEDFNISYEEKGGCFWHRYADGLNYWSEPEEMFAVMAKNDPKFKEKYDRVISTL